MSLLSKLMRKPLAELSDEVSKEVRSKVRIAIEEGLQTVDETTPVVADFLAGNEIELYISPIRIQLREVHKGAAFTGPKA